MIFITVGTTDFDDLIRMMDRIAGRLNERVVAQIGRGDYVPYHMEYFRFAPSLDRYFQEARVVVAHGGLGTLIEVIEKGGKLIGVDNPDRYDLHQEELLNELSARGHMIWCRELTHLTEVLQGADSHTFVPYEKPPCHIAEVIKDYLGRLKKE